MTQTKKDKWQNNGYFWLAVLIPILSVVLSIWFIYLAVHKGDSLVRDNWYMDGKSLENDLSKDSTASLYQLSASLTMPAQTTPLQLNLNAVVPFNFDKELFVHFYHATEEKYDQTIKLQRISQNNYQIVDSVLATDKMLGKYNIEIEGNLFRLRETAKMPFQHVYFKALPLEQTQLTAENTPK